MKCITSPYTSRRARGMNEMAQEIIFSEKNKKNKNLSPKKSYPSSPSRRIYTGYSNFKKEKSDLILFQSNSNQHKPSNSRIQAIYTSPFSNYHPASQYINSSLNNIKQNSNQSLYSSPSASNKRKFFTESFSPSKNIHFDTMNRKQNSNNHNSYLSYKHNNNNQSSHNQNQSTMSGLSNIGNTCYINATLQSLMRIKVFLDDLQLKVFKKTLLSQQNSKSTIYYHFLNLIGQISVSNHGVISNPLHSLKRIIEEEYRSFKGIAMQDAHEFLTEFFSWLQFEISSYILHSSQLSENENQMITSDCTFLYPIDRSFFSELSFLLLCKKCGYQRKSKDFFYTISLDLPDNNEDSNIININKNSPLITNKNLTSIKSLLTDFFSPRMVEYRCPMNDCNCDIVKISPSFTVLPRVLILHIKRFFYNNTNQTFEKRTDIIPINQTIDLSQYCSEHVISPLKPTIDQPEVVKILKKEIISNKREEIRTITNYENFNNDSNDSESNTNNNEYKEKENIILTPDINSFNNFDQESHTIGIINTDSNLSSSNMSNISEHQSRLFNPSNSLINNLSRDKNRHSTVQPKSQSYRCLTSDPVDSNLQIAIEHSLQNSDVNNIQISEEDNNIKDAMRESLLQSEGHDINKEEWSNILTTFQSYQSSTSASQDSEITDNNNYNDMNTHITEINNDKVTDSYDNDQKQNTSIVIEQKYLKINNERIDNDSLPIYKLTSIIRHRDITQYSLGNQFNSGHYISDCYDKKENCWKCYDDAVVRIENENNVLKNALQDGYIFFYTHQTIAESI